MFRLTVLYGHPKDFAEFERYYEETHVPLVKKLPGLKGYVVSKPQPRDSKESSPACLIAELYFEDRESYQEALASVEGQIAGADLQNFATGGATFLVGEVYVHHPLTLR